MDRSKEIQRCRNAVFRLFKFRPRSQKELRQKLKEKGFPSKVIEDTVQYFSEIQLVDDQQFASLWISSRLKKPFGLNRIRFELKQKGIDPEIISQETKRAQENYDESETILGLAQKRVAKYRNCNPKTAKRRLYDYLLRRGFQRGIIQKTITQIF